MYIRKATIDDIPAIVSLEKEVLKESLGTLFLYDEMMLNPFSRVFVALNEDQLIGYIGLRVDEQAELMNFAIARRCQHQGYGRKILTFVIQSLKDEGIKTLSLEVRESNIIAQKLY